MVLEKLGNTLKDTLGKIASSIFVDEKLINELVKDIQRALLQSDVNVKLVFSLTNKIKERIQKEETPSAITKKEHLINIVYEELTHFLGQEFTEIKPDKKPYKIMLVGLFGNGKTTSSGKLAKYFQKRGNKVGLVGLDIHRPAAMDQIKQIGDSINVPVFIDKEAKDVQEIWNKNEEELNKFDVIIIDTAGRDALSDDLVEELNGLNNRVQPEMNILVMAADLGQAAQTQAEKFNETCGVNGVIITKLDGTAKGGGALSACAVTNAPVKFIGVGEKVDDLEQFNPKRFVGRLLGMGDLETLLEKAKDAMSSEQAEDLGKKFLKGKFNLLDLYEQMQAMNKMGPLGKVMELIPGMGALKLPKDAIKVQEGKLKKWRYVMDSCTKAELEDPEHVIDTRRIDRISKGAGVSVSTVRELLKQYRQSKKMVKMMGGSEKNMQKMMKKLQQGGMPQMKFK